MQRYGALPGSFHCHTFQLAYRPMTFAAMGAVDAVDEIMKAADVAIARCAEEAASREPPWDGKWYLMHSNVLAPSRARVVVGFGGLVRVCDDPCLREPGVIRAVARPPPPDTRQQCGPTPPDGDIRQPTPGPMTRQVAAPPDASSKGPAGLGSAPAPAAAAAATIATPAQPSSSPASVAPQSSSEDKHQRVLVIPMGSHVQTGSPRHGTTTQPSAAEPSDAQAPSRASSSDVSSGVKEKEVALCRICLEEDSADLLEAPCACTGTQKFAHHECIQRWVDEKGHLRCEICDQPYRGAFTVPPQGAAGVDDPATMFSPLFAIRMDHGGDAVAGPGGPHDRAALDFLDEGDQYYQRNPLASWVFTFVVFVLFLVVLHHTMIVADGMDGPGDMDAPPASTVPTTGEDEDDYAASLTLFLFWIGTKAFLIGLPLYTVMRIAARQARREQYEAMFRSAAFEAPERRRYVWRVREQQLVPTGHNVV
ncbi:hypothetical protein TSOC_002326 [Tetrabaena socialis]|uniref:RING-CH-type domain-containing protein n=1 Tax=Tetrabaena socialis TaxID=47790 RepID=A0A2J8AEA7_9CHLO|nr:hypothetical protein TSOC_002326 [Tetrabaena socialis]|eukprot:PNH10853.1 hypothetical protein TSOC_002326 [Tetrabaena socialis]